MRRLISTTHQVVNMKREKLIEALKELLSDEYDAEDLVHLSKKELVQKLIDVALYYQERYNSVEE